MWKTFWGDDFSKISPSNRKNVVPGGWRIEVSPALPAEEDFFLHVCEIGNAGTTGGKGVVLVEGINFTGAVSEHGPCVLFATADAAHRAGEISLPDLPFNSFILSGLQPNSVYELSFSGPNVSSSPAAALPGIQTEMLSVRANSQGIVRVEKMFSGNSRVRIARV
jgi:hypothetical protein